MVEWLKLAAPSLVASYRIDEENKMNPHGTPDVASQ